MNLEDEGKFPVEKDFQDSLNVFYVNEVLLAWFVATAYGACQK